jgi:hypothetical protein
MSILNIIIGTGIIWALTSLIVMPIARLLTNSRARALAHSQVDAQGALVTTQVKQEISIGYFILVDVLVLGIAGLIAGLAWGWFFIGIAWKAKSWPGMIAFMAASFIGATIHG